MIISNFVPNPYSFVACDTGKAYAPIFWSTGLP